MRRKRIAELALEQQLAVVQRGDDDHRAGMGDPFAHRLVAIVQAHLITAYLEQRAFVHRLAADHVFFDQLRVIHFQVPAWAELCSVVIALS
jgi:hypothetical protein